MCPVNAAGILLVCLAAQRALEHRSRLPRRKPLGERGGRRVVGSSGAELLEGGTPLFQGANEGIVLGHLDAGCRGQLLEMTMPSGGVQIDHRVRPEGGMDTSAPDTASQRGVYLQTEAGRGPRYH